VHKWNEAFFIPDFQICSSDFADKKTMLFRLTVCSLEIHIDGIAETLEITTDVHPENIPNLHHARQK